MNIYCQVCSDFQTNSNISLIKHLKYTHSIESEEYYRNYLYIENEDICDCGNKKRYLNISKGYAKTCGHSCGAKQFRNRLKSDSIKFEFFSNKVSENQKRIWNDRKQNGEDVVIRNKIGQTIKTNNSKLTEQERLEKYSRYYTMDPESINRLNKKNAEWLMSNGGNYSNCLKGHFKPKNPEKYKGDPTKIIFRSSWERKFMIWLDTTPSILEWASEEVVIPYYSPIDGKMHRYFPDFTAVVRDKSGNLKNYMFEIKPKAQCIPPKKQTRMTKQYVNRVKTYAINEYKWKYAKEYCRKNGMEFQILTEDDLKIS